MRLYANTLKKATSGQTLPQFVVLPRFSYFVMVYDENAIRISLRAVIGSLAQPVHYPRSDATHPRKAPKSPGGRVGRLPLFWLEVPELRS